MDGGVSSNTKALVSLRIAVGALFLIFAEYKVFGTQFTLGGGFQFWIHRFLEQGAYPFMVAVLKNFLLPHATELDPKYTDVVVERWQNLTGKLATLDGPHGETFEQVKLGRRLTTQDAPKEGAHNGQ